MIFELLYLMCFFIHNTLCLETFVSLLNNCQMLSDFANFWHTHTSLWGNLQIDILFTAHIYRSCLKVTLKCAIGLLNFHHNFDIVGILLYWSKVVKIYCCTGATAVHVVNRPTPTPYISCSMWIHMKHVKQFICRTLFCTLTDEYIIQTKTILVLTQLK